MISLNPWDLVAQQGVRFDIPWLPKNSSALPSSRGQYLDELYLSWLYLHNPYICLTCWKNQSRNAVAIKSLCAQQLKPPCGFPMASTNQSCSYHTPWTMSENAYVKCGAWILLRPIDATIWGFLYFSETKCINLGQESLIKTFYPERSRSAPHFHSWRCDSIAPHMTNGFASVIDFPPQTLNPKAETCYF